jgi:hypothetical protein
LTLLEEIFFDLDKKTLTRYPRLNRMGGAEKANSLSYVLAFFIEDVVGTSSSSDVNRKIPSKR